MPPISAGDYSSQQEFMSDCMSDMLGSGRDQDQAVAICLSIWREGRSMKPQRKPQNSQVHRNAERWSLGASRDLPVAETERDWDGSAAASRMLDRASNEEGEVNGAQAKRGFLIYDAGNPTLRGSYSCPFADIVDGTLKAIPSGLRAAASRLPQVTDVSQEVKDRARGVLDHYFDKMNGGNNEEKKVKNGTQRLRKKQAPAPDPSEDRAAFFERCLSAVEGEGIDPGEAMAMCSTAWDEAPPQEEQKRLRRARSRKIKQAAPAVQEDESKSEYLDRCREAVAGEDVSDEEANSICEMAWEGSAAEEEKSMRKRWRMKAAPEVGDDESKSEYVERCTEAMMSDDVSEDEAEAACALAWENKAVARLRHKTHTGLVNNLEFILSDSTPDRMGDVIASEGWDLSSFRKNPIALFNHRADFPIGRWDDLRVEGGALRGFLRLAPEGTSERIDEIRKLIEADILKAVSVGFRPIRSQPRKVGEKMIGEYFMKQELVETSLVSVPANPNALAIAKNLDVSDEMLDLVFAKQGVRSESKQATKMSGKHATTTMRTTMSSAKLGENPIDRSTAMALAQRLSDCEARIVVLRDKLTDHLSNVDDSNVSDVQLETTNELNQRIQSELKQRSALIESIKMLAQTSEEEARTVVPQRTNGNGSVRTTSPHSYSRSSTGQSIPQTKEGRFDLIVRAGIIQAFAHRQKIGLDQALAKIAALYPRYGDDATRVFTEYTAKAEAFPAMTTVPGWAEELVQLIHSDYLELLMPKSVFPSLSNLGLSLSFGRAGRISIPTRNRVPSIGGSFVGEGEPIPVRMAEFRPLILTPKKLAVITTWTREMDEASIPAIEGVLRNAIQEDTAVAIDTVLLDAMPATNVRPPGLLDGVTAIAPSAATPPFNALVEDLKNLSGELITNTYGNVRKMVWIMNPQQVLGASLAVMPGVSAFPFKDEVGGGKLLGYPIIESGTVPMGTILAVDAAEFVTVGGEAPRFEISDQATLHMEDDLPSPITNGGTATPVRSLWQTDSIGLRLILPLNWAMRRPGCVAGITGVTW